jgi:transcription initiation factor TFIID TATA-box-binding protein
LLKLDIVNVVATSALSQVVDLDRVGALPFCLYDQGIYRCAYVRAPSMFSKVSIFSSGKMISAGSKTEKEAASDLHFVANMLTRSRIIGPQNLRIEIHNLVATLSLGTPLDLISIVSNKKHILYEPEQFPGAIYRPVGLIGVSILLFASGKAVIAGAKNRVQIHRACIEIEKITVGVSRFRH